MMKYKTLLFDADGTLLDFSYAEHSALEKTFSSHGITPTHELTSTFSKVNGELWSKFEKGEIEKAEILSTRFKKTLSVFNIGYSTEMGLESDYQKRLSGEHTLMPYADLVCQKLCKKYDMYIITNGLYTTQERRLSECGLIPYFKGYFVSERLGAQKPSIEYFERVLVEIGNPPKNEILIIGDSLSSDIQGGINSGLDTCWLKPAPDAPCGSIVPTYTILSLTDLFNIL